MSYFQGKREHCHLPSGRASLMFSITLFNQKLQHWDSTFKLDCLCINVAEIFQINFTIQICRENWCDGNLKQYSLLNRSHLKGHGIPISNSLFIRHYVYHSQKNTLLYFAKYFFICVLLKANNRFTGHLDTNRKTAQWSPIAVKVTTELK